MKIEEGRLKIEDARLTPRSEIFTFQSAICNTPFSRMPQEGGFSVSGGSTPVPPASSRFAAIARHFAAMPKAPAYRQNPSNCQNAGICPAYRSLT